MGAVTIARVLTLIAAALFLLAAFNVALGSLNVVALGLAFFAVSREVP